MKNKQKHMEFDTAEALWTLGMLNSPSLPSVATSALTEGLDSPALRQLAGLISVEESDATQLFSRALRELARGNLSKRLAAMKYALFISSEIVSGHIEPYRGARKIWEATLRVQEDDFHDLDPFIYAASEYDSRPEDRDYFLSEIIKEATRLIQERSSRIECG